MKIKNIILLFVLLLSGNLYAGASDWQEMKIVNGHMLIDVEIGGIPAKAMLDTGAETVALNVDFLDENNILYKNGKQLTLQGIFGEKKTHFVKNVKVNLLGAEFPIKNAFPLHGQGNFQMIIGLPFFKQFIFQFDYPNSRFKLITRDYLDLNEIANVDMQHGNSKKSLVVSAKLEGKETIDLLFDTGSTSGLYLERHFAKRRGWLEKYSKAKGMSSGVNEVIENEILVLPSLKFGPYTLEDVITIVPAEDMITNITKKQQKAKLGTRFAKGAKEEGILGYDILKHFVITLDAKTAKMHIIAP